MKKNLQLLLLILILLLLVYGTYAVVSNYYKKAPNQNSTKIEKVFDPLNTKYLIENQEIILIDGQADGISVFGEVTKGDLNNDGLDDAALMLVNNYEGSGIFYYVATAINANPGTRGSNAVFLGDRIAPQNIEIKDGQIIANYAVRGIDEAMTTPPSLGISTYLGLEDEILKVEENSNSIINNGATINNFEECLNAGNQIMESYPRRCQAGNQIFTEDIGNELEKTELITLENPRPNQIISSPLIVKGRARGNWFFEASFPVTLVNWDGLIIAEGFAQAQGDWMTTEFVPFEATLNFTIDPDVYSKRGALILRKANPSDLPEFDDALEIPVIYK